MRNFIAMSFNDGVMCENKKVQECARKKFCFFYLIKYVEKTLKMIYFGVQGFAMLTMFSLVWTDVFFKNLSLT